LAGFFLKFNVRGEFQAAAYRKGSFVVSYAPSKAFSPSPLASLADPRVESLILLGS